ncbi:MAG TPA: alpha/beta fold hydrolase [Dehalococcoidia bacterium]|jgi:pimeloyl-ACP methyl ester carboxylesterase|nr:alpha/beta fold hydrolase [Dehalococcoidia bacterium]
MPHVAAEDGVRIYYEVAGEGRPVLLMAGAFQTLEDWHDSGVFDELARDRRVIAMDLRGHGRSDAPHDAAVYGWPKNARDAAAVLAGVDAQDADVYGFSMGGNIAMAMLHGDLSRIRSIAGSGVLLPPPDFPVPAPPLVERAEALRRGGVAEALGAESMTDDRPPEWSLQRSLAGDAQAFAAEAEAQAQLEDQTLPPAGPPTLFISAERDAMSVALSNDLPTAYPYVRYVQIANANHFIGIMPDILPTLRAFWRSLGA